MKAAVKLNPLASWGMAFALALGLAACGGSSTTPEGPTAEELAMQCTDDGGRVEADGSCTSAEMLKAERAKAQADALKMAADEVTMALESLGGTPEQSAIDAASTKVAALKAALDAAVDVSDDLKAGYMATHSTAATAVMTAQTARNTANDDAQKAADAAMMAMALKLHTGIGAPVGNGTGNDDRFAAYSGTNDSQISVTIGTGAAVGTAVALSEDKMASVAANHGWAGKRFADPAGGEEYEAMVYSNVEAPTPGDKFGQVGVTTAADGYEYGLNAAGELATLVAANVASPSFDHTAGTKEFELPANTVRVMLSGSYHGVAGTYYCTPTGGGTDCSAEVAATGFTLAGGTWVFKPSNPEARVMSSMDTAYSSYGWWIRTATDGKVTVSAFHDHKDGATAPTTVDLPEAGTATYVGGAAGKYALSRGASGANDAGHFTARATLEAEFGASDANTISGTIDQFIGADGESRDWSVKLNETDITDAGVIDGLGSADGTAVGTVWTIGDDAAAKSGNWSGALREQGTDGVPGAVTGTFYSEYGNFGRMVGGFGATE